MRIEPIEIFSHCYINNYSSRTPLLLARKFSKDFYNNPHYGLFFQFYSNLIDCFKFSFIEQYSRLLFIFLYKMVSYFTIVTDRSFNPVKDLWLGKLYFTNYLIFLKYIPFLLLLFLALIQVKIRPLFFSILLYL